MCTDVSADAESRYHEPRQGWHRGCASCVGVDGAARNESPRRECRSSHSINVLYCPPGAATLQLCRAGAELLWPAICSRATLRLCIGRQAAIPCALRARSERNHLDRHVRHARNTAVRARSHVCHGGVRLRLFAQADTADICPLYSRRRDSCLGHSHDRGFGGGGRRPVAHTRPVRVFLAHADSVAPRAAFA